MNTIKIDGMKCMHCVGSVKKALEGVGGLQNIEVDLENKEARYDGSADLEQVKKAITDKGFQVKE